MRNKNCLWPENDQNKGVNLYCFDGWKCVLYETILMKEKSILNQFYTP